MLFNQKYQELLFKELNSSCGSLSFSLWPEDFVNQATDIKKLHYTARLVGINNKTKAKQKKMAPQKAADRPILQLAY